MAPVTITEALLLPWLAAGPGRPLITHYDDDAGSRIELSGATVANWAAKTANWLRDECDVEPGDGVAMLLPAHWQTLGVLLGSWWCGARVVARTAGARVAFVPPGENGVSAETVAVVALDPLGAGLRADPGNGALDYLAEVRACGDDFVPWEPIPSDTLALEGSTMDETVEAARRRAAELALSPQSRVLSTVDWGVPGGVIDGPLAVLAAGASLVQCGNCDPAKLAERRETERITADLPACSHPG